MDKIIAMHVKDNMKNTTYLLLVVLGIGIMLFLFQKQVAIYSNIESLSFMNIYMFIYPNITLYIVTLAATISNTSIIEKASGRIEYYLANKVKLKLIYRTYSIVIFILGIIPVIIFDICSIIYCRLFSSFSPLLFLKDLKGIVLIILIIIFFYNITMLLNNIVMLTKNLEYIRTAIMMISFGILYVLSFATSFIAKIGVETNTFVITIVNGLVIINIPLLLANFFLMKKISAESIVLSSKA